MRLKQGAFVTLASSEQTQDFSPEQIAEAIQILPLPFALIDLDSLSVIAASDAAVELIGRPFVGTPWLKVMPPADRKDAKYLLDLLRSGHLRRFVSFVPSFGPRSTPMTFWGSVLQFGVKRYVLGWGSTGSADQASPLARYLGREPLEVAVGTVDSDWRIRTISREAERLLGVQPNALVGTRLDSEMAQPDVHRLLEAKPRVDALHSVAVTVRWEQDDESREFTCFLARPAGMEDLVFMLVPDHTPPPPAGGSRTAELEHHLVKIAAEVEASGVLHRFFALPDPERMPELQRLSVRQWEIMSRLLQGERVPAIARDLFVSPSTVRNQLSTIFRRFGVHSQAELLGVLATRRAGGSPPKFSGMRVVP